MEQSVTDNVGHALACHGERSSPSCPQPRADACATSFDQPQARRPSRGLKSRLIAGCGQDCPPHNLHKTAARQELIDIGLKPAPPARCGWSGPLVAASSAMVPGEWRRGTLKRAPQRTPVRLVTILSEPQSIVVSMQKPRWTTSPTHSFADIKLQLPAPSIARHAPQL